MPRLSLIVPILLLALPCLAAKTVAEVFDHPVTDPHSNPELMAAVQRMASANRVRSEFRQTKTLKLLRRPLLSEGQMLFDRQHGLCWSIESPVKSELVVTPDRIVQGGNSITAQTNPVAFGFAQTFFRVLTGDLQTLQQQFEVFFESADGPWEIGLVPRDGQLQAVLQSIVLSGSDDLDSVNIADHAGDVTTMEFFQRRTGGAELSAPERSCFDL